MKILSWKEADGNVLATLQAECPDIRQFGGAREAVEGCIRLFEEESGLGQLALPRVTRMDTLEDGCVEFDFDAAVPPEVELGQYLGLEVYVPSDEEPDLPVLRAVAENMRVRIPETYISRKTDSLIRRRLEDVAQRTGFVTLADMAAILETVNSSLALHRSDGELWDAAVAAADEMSGALLRAHSTEETVEIIAGALFGEGAEDRNGAIAEALKQRAAEKQRTNPEILAEECFRCYLRMAGKTEESLCKEFREQAEELVRFDLLIEEVIRREGLEISDDEFNAALETIAGMYDMHPAEVLQVIGTAALRDQLLRDKARAMLVDSAKRI